MKLISALVAIVGAFSAMATPPDSVPLTAETLVGSWEALSPGAPAAVLLRMEINKKGESYLAQITVGTSLLDIFRLVSSEVKEGKVRLHFERTDFDDPLNRIHQRDLWVVGVGDAVQTDGIIQGRISSGRVPPEDGKSDVVFIKGEWARTIAEASKKTEQAIKERASAR